jgi:hypothetical protein
LLRLAEARHHYQIHRRAFDGHWKLIQTSTKSGDFYGL